jgi:hypothetical protein
MKTIGEPYIATDDEHVRIMRASTRVLRVLSEADLTSADVMNLLTNLIAEIAVVECLDRESLVVSIGRTYDLHLEASAKDETLN